MLAPKDSPKVLHPQHVALFLLGTVVFALTYAQAPLYFSNQNQYFLHGLAAAGFGSLAALGIRVLLFRHGWVTSAT